MGNDGRNLKMTLFNEHIFLFSYVLSQTTCETKKLNKLKFYASGQRSLHETSPSPEHSLDLCTSVNERFMFLIFIIVIYLKL